MTAWKYTAAERRTIDAAYSLMTYIVDHMGHSQPSAIRDALRHERRERSSVTVAKALLVAGFVNGRKYNPRAADLAWLSAGIMTATIVGADSRRLDRKQPCGTLAGDLDRLPKMAAAAAAAHDAYIDRGRAAASNAAPTTA